MERPPYFAFYPVDFASDLHVESMSTLQVGAYMLLLCKAWQADPPASLPNDDQILSRLARLDPAEWAEVRSGVLAPFSLGSDGRLHQKRLRQEYDEAVQRMKKKSKAGQVGASRRWGDGGKPATTVAPDGNRIATALAVAQQPQCDRNAIQTQSSSASQKSEPVGSAVPVGSKDRPAKAKPRPVADSPFSRTVEAFCSRWAVRHGGKYVFAEGEDGKHVKAILDAAGGDEALVVRAFDLYLASNEGFHDREAHPLRLMKREANKWLTAARKNAAEPDTLAAARETREMLDRAAKAPPGEPFFKRPRAEA